MGTRHLTVVAVDGSYKVAQYGQWDGYFSGAGVVSLNALHKALQDEKAFANKARAAVFLTDDEVRARWASVGAKEDGWVTNDVAEAFAKRWPQLSRDVGADVLNMLRDGEPGMELTNHIEFAGDSLFCEFVYVIDLDQRRFEVYEGFNKMPLHTGERFFDFNRPDSEYRPVKLRAYWDFDQLPSAEDFLGQLKEESEEEEDA